MYNHIREEFGRLYAGGTDPHDVASALGMVPNGLGKELLIYLNLTEWAVGRDQVIWKHIKLLCDTEVYRQKMAVLNAEVGQELAKVMSLFRDVHEQPVDAQYFANYLPAGRYLSHRPWPTGHAEMLPKMAHEVLGEMMLRRLCDTCEGAGHVAAPDEEEFILADCPSCEGLGYIPKSYALRAMSLGVSEIEYRKDWHGMYSWFLRTLTGLESSAAEEFDEALNG